MDIVDRMLAHDYWTTSQLLLACESLSDTLLDREFEIDHLSLRKTFIHLIQNIETWTDLLFERPVQKRSGDAIPQLLVRLNTISPEFIQFSQKIVREQKYNDRFLDILDQPPQLKTFGGVIGHVITHNMHHRAQIMFLMEKIGIKDHIEGDLLSWENGCLQNH